MQTLQPSIVIGSYTWDQDRFPRDEFQIRMAELHRAMDANGWKAALIYGDTREHATLAYFSNFTPRLRWAMGLFPREGEPRLLGSMSSRDVPAMKLMTWIPDVMSGWTWESAFDPWLARLAGPEPIGIGAFGLDLMRPALYRSLEKSLGNRVRLHSADAILARPPVLRPRERSQLREACAVARVAAEVFVRAWREGMGVEAAALEAELSARRMAAQDVRTLLSFDRGRTLSPFRGAFDAKSDVLSGYVAVKHMGYWAELFVHAGGPADDLAQRAAAALDAMLQAAKPGVIAGDLHAKALDVLAPHQMHPILSASVGRRIGFSPNEGGELRAGSRDALKPGEVYALHAGARDDAGGAIASAMIAITANGAEVLLRAPGPPSS
jgi:Xaa-Pro aminopeptidase